MGTVLTYRVMQMITKVSQMEPAMRRLEEVATAITTLCVYEISDGLGPISNRHLSKAESLLHVIKNR